MLRKSEPKLTYALNADDELVSIKTILVRGLKCNCRCPKCNKPLEAKLGNGGRQPHFSHSKDSDCHGSYMTTLHLLAEQIIKEEKLVMAPAYKEIKSHKLVFKHVEIEQRVDRKDLQPDIVGITEDNLRWTIEIFNTHEVDEDKRAKLIESGITCLEIDVSHQTLENLRTFLLESTENRKWINNPNSDLQIATAKRKIISLIKNFIVKKHELSIPPYKKQGEFKNICIQKSTTVEESKDRLLSRVKVTSIDGTALIINIGSRFELDYLIALGECNELNINIDNLPIDTDVISSIEMEWFYNYAFEKERKARAIDDANNPKYEERPLSDCKFKCKYELYNGMCIYQKGTIKKNGISYVICNKEKREKEEGYISLRDQNNNNTCIRNISTNDEYKEKRGLPHDDMLLSESLPFDKYWTIEEYFENLQSTGVYIRESGSEGKVVKCDKSDNIIMILYKVYISNGLCEQYIYYIDKVSIINGELQKTNVDFYYNEAEALIKLDAKIKKTEC